MERKLLILTVALTLSTVAFLIEPISTRAQLTPPHVTSTDFDADSKSDLAVWRPSDGFWWIASVRPTRRVLGHGVQEA